MKYHKKTKVYIVVTLLLVIFVGIGYAYLSTTLTMGGNVKVLKKAVNPVSFEEDSWDTIISAVKEGNTGKYHVGDMKEVEMRSFGTHKLRIANMSTPSECSGSEFSKTACGFVLEFADIITKHVMNSSDTNVGGWLESNMRTYVNQDVYNALPSELKSGIIDTFVVSGHGTEEYLNFTSTDKLYLLSTREIWGKESTINAVHYDTIDAYTRQLDYYKNLGVTTSNATKEDIKQYNGSNSIWWLRSAYSYSNSDFYTVNTNGDWGLKFATNSNGVSPAFRIG